MKEDSSSSSSGRLDSSLVKKAVNALLKHHESSSRKKDSLLGNDKWMHVQLTLNKVPAKVSPKPIRLDIPHALWNIEDDDNKKGSSSSSLLQEPDVCIIVKESSKPAIQEMIANFPQQLGCIKKVLGLDSLRRKHCRYQQQRALVAKYDVFLADDRILPMLGKALGKRFFEDKKQPIPVNVTRTTALAPLIFKSLQSTFFHLSTGTCLSVRIGSTAMSGKQIQENVASVLPQVVSRLPKKRWSNIQNISIKTSDSIALPIYTTLPSSDEIDDDDDQENVAAMEVEVDKKEKEERKAAKAKSPLVRALKKELSSSSNKRKTKDMEEDVPKDSSSTSSNSTSKKKKKKKSMVNEDEELSHDGDDDKKLKKKKKRKNSIDRDDDNENDAVTPSPKKAKTSSSVSEQNKANKKKATKKLSKGEDNSTPPSRKDAEFIPSKTFKGSKAGYVFRRGDQGNGYYVDRPPVVDRMAMDALKRLSSSASKAQRGKKSKKGGGGRRRKSY